MQPDTHPAVLNLTARPLVMGIINCTPDSFLPSSRSPEPEVALETAKRMIREGADLLDIGGESSRPGATYLEAREEIERIIPVIKALRRFSDIPISVDTRKAAVARAAFAAGADILNDISSLADDPELAGVAADAGATVVLMHKRGDPVDMQRNPSYEDTLGEIIQDLGEGIARARAAGIPDERIILDPGIGFGKRQEDNLLILKELRTFTELGFPLLVGHSRKSFLGKITGREPEERLAASLAAGVIAQQNGAAILRVHDVAATRDALRVVAAISGVGC